MKIIFFFNFRKSGAHGGMILTGKPKNSEKNLSQCHFVRHKFHWIDPGTNPGRRGERPATNQETVFFSETLESTVADYQGLI
jgi:hypothetical protein